MRRSRKSTTKAEIAARVELLRRVRLFASASDADLNVLADTGTERWVGKGTEVVREGRLPTHIFVIGDGRFEVVSSGESDGVQRVVNVLSAGEHFGEIGLIEGMPATATVRAEGRARVLEIPGRDFLEYLDRTASLGDVAERISTRLARTHPTYSPSAAGSTDEKDIVARALREWTDEDVAVLLEGLARLEALDPAARRRALRELGT